MEPDNSWIKTDVKQIEVDGKRNNRSKNTLGPNIYTVISKKWKSFTESQKIMYVDSQIL